MFRKHFFPFIVWALYRAWTATWRVQIIESSAVKRLKAENKSWICAIWHGDEIAMIYFSRFYKVATMTSTSKDGELMNNVLNRLGMATSRGSSTRGAVGALKGLVRLAKSGWNPVVTVDGPKGPYHKAKPGVFELARLTGLPIIPAGVAATHKKIFEKSWNKAYLPLPFSKVTLVWGDLLLLNENENPESFEPRDPVLAKTLENTLDAMSRIAAETLCK